MKIVQVSYNWNLNVYDVRKEVSGSRQTTTAVNARSTRDPNVKDQRFISSPCAFQLLKVTQTSSALYTFTFITKALGSVTVTASWITSHCFALFLRVSKLTMTISTKRNSDIFWPRESCTTCNGQIRNETERLSSEKLLWFKLLSRKPEIQFVIVWLTKQMKVLRNCIVKNRARRIRNERRKQDSILASASLSSLKRRQLFRPLLLVARPT